MHIALHNSFDKTIKQSKLNNGLKIRVSLVQFQFGPPTRIKLTEMWAFLFCINKTIQTTQATKSCHFIFSIQIN